MSMCFAVGFGWANLLVPVCRWVQTLWWLQKIFGGCFSVWLFGLIWNDERFNREGVLEAVFFLVSVR
jgi:hypothetical protein